MSWTGGPDDPRPDDRGGAQWPPGDASWDARGPEDRRNPQLGRDPGWGRDGRDDGLRPLDLGDVLDGMFRIAGRHWQAFAIGLGVIVVPMALLTGLAFAQLFADLPSLSEQLSNPEVIDSVEAGPSADEVVTLVGGAALAGLVSLFATPLLYGIAVRIAADGYRTGRVEPMPAVRAALRRYPALLGSTLLFGIAAMLVVVVPMVVVGALIAAAASGGGGPGGGLVVVGVLAVLAALVGAVVAMVRLALFVPAVVIEEAGAYTSLRRSNALVRGRTGVTFGWLLVVSIIVTIIGFVLGLPFQIGVFTGGLGAAVITTVGSIVTNLVSNALWGVALVLIYFDRRVRSEGYDLEQLADELDRGPGTGW